MTCSRLSSSRVPKPSSTKSVCRSNPPASSRTASARSRASAKRGHERLATGQGRRGSRACPVHRSSDLQPETAAWRCQLRSSVCRSWKRPSPMTARRSLASARPSRAEPRGRSEDRRHPQGVGRRLPAAASATSASTTCRCAAGPNSATARVSDSMSRRPASRAVRVAVCRRRAWRAASRACCAAASRAARSGSCRQRCPDVGVLENSVDADDRIVVPAQPVDQSPELVAVHQRRSGRCGVGEARRDEPRCSAWSATCRSAARRSTPWTASRTQASSAVVARWRTTSVSMDESSSAPRPGAAAAP